MSENTLPIAMNVPGAVRLGSVGRPLTENRVRLTQEGEICVKGPGVCEGYWKTEANFPTDDDGFYHTGDMGRMDAEGFLYVNGRRDDVFKTSTGRKIAPTRLESVYGASPLFERVMAIGQGQPYPALLLWLKTETTKVLEKGGERLLQEEVDRLGENLLPYERAGAFLVVGTQPAIADGTLTPSLKLRRAIIEERMAPRIAALYKKSPDQGFPAIKEHPMANRGDRPKILFVPEGVALSHPARLLQLARQLDPEQYEIHFATDQRYQAILGPTSFHTHTLESISAPAFDRTVARGGVVYTEEVLEHYVRQERALFQKVRPDMVVGEWRPSLGISARLEGVPYISVLNAYWSPNVNVRHILPEYTMTEWLPRSVGQHLYNRLRPLGYALHARPVNAVRRRHGLAAIPNDFRYALTDGDGTLFPDLEYLFPISTLTDTQRCMAPISWSPKVPLPSWWNQLPTDRPIVYANLGSSGRSGILQWVLDAAATLPVTVIAATAGRQTGLVPPPNAFFADFLPGQESAARSDLVITNGGNMSSYQALAEGKPVLGLAGNVDQFLNMATVEDAGAGKLLRAGSSPVKGIRAAVVALLGDTRAHRCAECLGAELAITSQRVFPETVERTLKIFPVSG